MFIVGNPVHYSDYNSSNRNLQPPPRPGQRGSAHGQAHHQGKEQPDPPRNSMDCWGFGGQPDGQSVGVQVSSQRSYRGQFYSRFSKYMENNYFVWFYIPPGPVFSQYVLLLYKRRLK